MKWIGQHIIDLIARFRSDVYLEDIDTGTIASGGNLGLDSNNKIVKATVSSGSGDITGVDLTGVSPINIGSETGTTSGDYSANISIDVASATNKGVVELATTAETTTGTDADRAVTPDGLKDGYQGSTNVTTLGTIGTGTWQGTAITKDYIAADQRNITAVGILGAGTWRGVDIATDQQKHLANFEFEGFSVGDGTNYMIPEINSDTKAPFEHQTSTGSDGLTATSVIRLLRTSGHVMPYAGTLKLWKGWATSSGNGQTVDVGLYKFTLVNNDTADVSPVALKNTSFTSVTNTRAFSFSETSFSVAFAAGDILISAIRNGTNNKKCEFTSTLVVEWD